MPGFQRVAWIPDRQDLKEWPGLTLVYHPSSGLLSAIHRLTSMAIIDQKYFILNHPAAASTGNLERVVLLVDSTPHTGHKRVLGGSHKGNESALDAQYEAPASDTLIRGRSSCSLRRCVCSISLRSLSSDISKRQQIRNISKYLTLFVLIGRN